MRSLSTCIKGWPYAKNVKCGTSMDLKEKRGASKRDTAAPARCRAKQCGPAHLFLDNEDRS